MGERKAGEPEKYAAAGCPQMAVLQAAAAERKGEWQRPHFPQLWENQKATLFPRVAFRAYIVAACYSTEIR